jgi:hypothetical protein
MNHMDLAGLLQMWLWDSKVRVETRRERIAWFKIGIGRSLVKSFLRFEKHHQPLFDFLRVLRLSISDCYTNRSALHRYF